MVDSPKTEISPCRDDFFFLLLFYHPNAKETPIGLSYITVLHHDESDKSIVQ